MNDTDRTDQDDAQLISEQAQSKLPEATRMLIKVIREAKQDAADDAEEILSSWMRYTGFDNRTEAMTWLKQLADAKTREGLRKKISTIEDDDLREIWTRRLDAPAYLHRLTNRKAVSDMVELSMMQTASKIKGTLTPTLEAVVTESANRAMFSLQKQVRVGWSFEQPNKRQLEAMLREKGLDRTVRTFTQNIEAVSDNAIIEGILSGRSTERISEEVADITMTDYRTAKRLVRTELTKAANEGQTYAMRDAGLTKYEYRCVFDERTCPVCGQLDGKVFELKDKEMGVNYPPMHPNCRCMHVAALTKEIRDTLTRSARDSNGKTISVPMTMTYDEWGQKFLGRTPQTAKTVSTAPSKVRQRFIDHNVEERPVAELPKPLTPEETISKVGGGDLTKGSCSSLGLAYAGNRLGYDVRDFRGGESLNTMGSISTIQDLTKLDGVKSNVVSMKSDIKSAVEVLKAMDSDKEYYFVTGQHCAIVRKAEQTYEYLELQSAWNNGFHPLSTQVLKDRFGCKTSHRVSGMPYEIPSLSIDIESLRGNDEFKNILGYINTEEGKERKGIRGSIK